MSVDKDGKRLNRESRERKTKNFNRRKGGRAWKGYFIRFTYCDTCAICGSKTIESTTESTKDTKMKISENFVISVPFVVQKRTSSTATPMVVKILFLPAEEDFSTANHANGRERMKIF